jgi:NitT/TauT family transport system substrate-binding protein
VHHALLAEPAVSMALLKTRSLPMSVVAPTLHRALDLQQEWARVFKRSARIPQAGIVALSEAAQDKERLRLFQQAYTNAAQWCLANRESCGAEVAAREPRLSAEAVAESLGVTKLDSTPALAARDELRFLFERLLRRNPQLLGGKLPDDGFFASA